MIPDFLAQIMHDSHIQLGNVQTYMRLFKDSKLIVGEAYPRHLRTSSSHVLYSESDGEKKVGAVYNFLKVSYCDCEKTCFCEGQHYAVITHILKTDSFNAKGDGGMRTKLAYLHKCQKTDNMLFIPVAALQSLCVFISIDDHSFVGTPINSMELE